MIHRLLVACVLLAPVQGFSVVPGYAVRSGRSLSLRQKEQQALGAVNGDGAEQDVSAGHKGIVLP